MSDTQQQMKPFVEPESVAAIGVSRRTGPGAFNLLENLVSYGYEGRLYPVNPNATEILGVKTYPSVSSLPEVVDLALISLPRDIYYLETLPVQMRWMDSAIIVAGALVISLLATIYPAHQAAKLNPAQTLRYE